jgi:hypothetical protein
MHGNSAEQRPRNERHLKTRPYNREQEKNALETEIDFSAMGNQAVPGNYFQNDQPGIVDDYQGDGVEKKVEDEEPLTPDEAAQRLGFSSAEMAELILSQIKHTEFLRVPRSYGVVAISKLPSETLHKAQNIMGTKYRGTGLPAMEPTGGFEE